MDNNSKNFFPGLRRIGTIFSQHCLAGLNPLIASLSNPCVRTRFLTAAERHKQQRYDQISSEAKKLRYQLNITKRRQRTLKIGRHIFLLITRIASQELRFEVEKREHDNQNLKADSVKHASEVIKAQLKMDELERTLDEAARQLITARKERDEALSMLQVEQKKCQDEENYRSIAISSLRSRFQREKGKMSDEIRELQYKIRTQQLEIKEMQSLAHESLQDIDKLERTIARLEQNEMVSQVSQHLSNVLSDISAVALVRPADRQTVEEKIRDIRDCIRDMSKELQSRRRNADRWRERVFALEEEKKLWICNETRHEAEFRRLQKSIVAVDREIPMLRKGQQ